MTDNQLLDRLPAAERRRVLALCVLRPLHRGEPLCTQDQALRGLLFPVAGCVVLLTALDQHLPLQVGMVGREGVLGAQLLLGVPRSPVSALVLGAGQGWGLTALALRRQLASCPVLQRLLAGFLAVQLRDAATAAACLHFHALPARLARWLLMGQDRMGQDHADGPGFAVTQALLAQHLGVRRAGVTVAAGALQRAGLIRYHRGWVTVCDRPGLAATACSCYAQDLRSYAEGIGSLGQGSAVARRSTQRPAGVAGAAAAAVKVAARSSPR